MTRAERPRPDVPGESASHGRSYRVIALMAAVLASSVYMRSGLTVLSGFVIEEFGISRSQFGWIFAVFALSGTVMSPVMGPMADGSVRRAVLAVFGFAAVGTILASVSWSFPVVMAAAAVDGVALATGNPITNRVIAERVPLSSRGGATGFKQSGPMLTMIVAGLTLPSIALVLNWRWALAAGLIAPALGAVATMRIIEPDRVVIPRSQRRSLDRAERHTVTWLASTSFLMAMSLASIRAFLPLYAQEEVAMSATGAGLIAAMLGLGGVIGRIGLTHVEHRFRSRITLLVVIPLGAAAATAMIALASPESQWLLSVGSFVGGSLMLAWHAVASLFVINASHPQSIGRSSAFVQVGTFLGFGFGPPLTGYLVDGSGSYDLNWVVVMTLFTIVSFMALRLRYYLAAQAQAGRK